VFTGQHNPPYFTTYLQSFQHLRFGAMAAFVLCGCGDRRSRDHGALMETMLQTLVIVGGLTFSIAASLLIEELIFGQIVRLAFARRPTNKTNRIGS
jgi:hypothetical protein